MSESACRWNHQPPAEHAKLPHGVGGWTIAFKFFEDVEGENTLEVNKVGIPYGVMVNIRNNYETYYAIRMSDISDLVDDLNTELTILVIEENLDSIHDKIAEIDAEYLDKIQDMHTAMDSEDEDLYDNYIIYLNSL